MFFWYYHDTAGMCSIQHSLSPINKDLTLDMIYKKQNVLDLLHRRERYGVCQNHDDSFSHVDRLRRVHCRDLSIVSSWNSKRLQNMILAVGPGTPAAMMAEESNNNSSSGDADGYDGDEYSRTSITNSQSTDLDSENEMHLAENDVEQGDGSLSEERSYVSRDHVHGDVDESDTNSEQSHASSRRGNLSTAQQSSKCSKMAHSGCINTAAWMDCPWRLTTVRTDDSSFLNTFVSSTSHSSNSAARVEMGRSNKAIQSKECPTQLITSGDDRIIKFWDVGLSMGTLSPLPCPTTYCPFLNSKSTSSFLLKKSWKNSHHGRNFPGTIHLLASMRTGHRGNVFHATPLFSKPGSILTCAADGLLNLCHIETERTSTILSLDDTLSRMCFSHHMLDEHTGLLCTESGLRRFDMRVPRSSQAPNALLGNDICKSCAVYSASDAESSSYAFVGGASSEVSLYDLRFLGDPSKVVQQYRPTCFPKAVDVAVSGLDISKDRKELLVSYENDQIYTFPIFPDLTVDPSVDEMQTLCKLNEEKSESKKVCSQFAGYGGHLNRFTFLKCAKYAGPNDEYICTGSDSGHAFVYNKYSGAIVSLLKADNSTCNGIIPHPTLPVFVTYGISPTAKLWRATIPVDDQDDDSISGRRRAYQEEKYEKSDVVSRWGGLRCKLAKMSAVVNLEKSDVTIFPDEVPASGITANADNVEAFFRNMLFEDPFNPGSDIICNDLKSLPDIIKSNFHEANISGIEDVDYPIRCGVNELRRRTSIIRLCYQAQRHGLRIVDDDKPWLQEPITFRDDESQTMSPPSSIIPESPGDWLPNEFGKGSSKESRSLFNKLEYGDFYYSRYYPPFYHSKPSQNDTTEISEEEAANAEKEEEEYDSSKAWDALYDTIKNLKEEGNVALKEGSVHLAGRLYDKAIVYCAVAFMGYPQSTLDFATSHQEILSKNSGHCVRWTELLKTFVSTRLNLSMTMLKKEISDPSAACTQAALALQDLVPFCSAAGVVLTGKKLNKIRQNEPIETFKEAKELQVKAYFRLGSANLQSGDYYAAIQNLKLCLQAKKEIHPDAVPDKLVVNRLAEARDLSKRQKKRRRNQFNHALQSETEEK